MLLPDPRSMKGTAAEPSSPSNHFQLLISAVPGELFRLEHEILDTYRYPSTKTLLVLLRRLLVSTSYCYRAGACQPDMKNRNMRYPSNQDIRSHPSASSCC